MENKDSIERKNKGTYFLFDCPNKNDTLCKTDQHDSEKKQINNIKNEKELNYALMQQRLKSHVQNH